MATQKQIASCVGVLSGLDTAVSDTFRTQAGLIGDKLTSVFGSENWELESADVEALIEGITETASWRNKPERQRSARQSEFRAIIKGYPFLRAGSEYFADEYGAFNKEHLLKIARTAIEYASAEDCAADAVAFFEARDKKQPTTKTQREKLVAGLKQALANTSGTKQHAELVALVKRFKLARACGI